MNARVYELMEIISKAQVELLTIQNRCPHKKFSVVRFSHDNTSFHPTRFCDECHATIPGITEEEAQQVYEEDLIIQQCGGNFSLN